MFSGYFKKIGEAIEAIGISDGQMGHTVPARCCDQFFQLTGAEHKGIARVDVKMCEHRFKVPSFKFQVSSSKLQIMICYQKLGT
jgi:hypothetical protein